jgi:hypothetical protein
MWDDQREICLLIQRAFQGYLRYRRHSRRGRLAPCHLDTLRRLAEVWADLMGVRR